MSRLFDIIDVFIEEIAMLSVSEGVTSFLPTMCASMKENFEEFLERGRVVSKILGRVRKGARPAGINLELFMYPGLMKRRRGGKEAMCSGQIGWI